MSLVMKEITQKLELAIYGYNPNEFLPIFEDGELSNRSAFVAYKAKRVLSLIGL